jgi:hypothetical protein
VAERVGRVRLASTSLLLPAVLLVGSCGTGGPSGSPSCTAAETIQLVKDRVIFHGSAAALQGCQAFPAGAQVDIDQEGQADGAFGMTADCRFRQLPPAAGAASASALKTENVLSGDMGDLFGMLNGQAHCTLRAGGSFRLCARATVAAVTTAGKPSGQVRATCNSDPFVEVAVRPGGAAFTIQLDGQTSAKPTPVPAGKDVRVDLVTGTPMTTTASFSKDEDDLFQAQALALPTAG